MAQSFTSNHRYSNTGFLDHDEATIRIKLSYAQKGNACDTLFIGKEKHFILCCGSYNGFEKGHKLHKDESRQDGYTLCQDINPKNGRVVSPLKFKNPKSDWYWLIYLNEMCGHKMNRVVHVNFKTNEYIAYAL